MSEVIPLMRLEQVAKSYGRHDIFENFSLDIKKGDSVLIQGPSGCGKTTLLRCMALLEPIDKGYIKFEGCRVLVAGTKAEPERHVRLAIGMVFQHLYLWPHLTVLENISLPLRLASHISNGQAEEKAREVLRLLNIGDKAAEYPVRLSGGQQQRVALGRALVHAPKLLLLDEITANLDPITSARVLEAVEAIWKRGTTIVLASHASQIPESLKKVMIQYETGNWRIEPT